MDPADSAERGGVQTLGRGIQRSHAQQLLGKHELPVGPSRDRPVLHVREDPAPCRESGRRMPLRFEGRAPRRRAKGPARAQVSGSTEVDTAASGPDGAGIANKGLKFRTPALPLDISPKTTKLS